MTAAFWAVRGREPSEQERTQLFELAGSADLASLIDWLHDSDEAAQRVLDRTPAALDRQLRRTADDPVAGAGTPRLIFLHIMKAAGTSLSHMLERWAQPARSQVHVHLDELLLLPRLQLANLAVVAGHIPYEALALMPSAFRTLTVLRDPVERTISHYRELRRSRQAYAELGLDEFLYSDVFDVPSGNYQARQLAHSIGLADAWFTYSPPDRNSAVGGDPADAYPLQSLFDSTPLRYRDQELLDIAASNLASIDYVGITEDLDCLAGRIAPLFGAGETSVPRLHVSETRGAEELTATQRRRVESRTEVDRELHQLARRLAAG